MKKIVSILMIASCLLVSQSCKKESKIEETNQVINHVLQVNQSYLLDLGSFGFEEGASIIRQASHFSTSELNRNDIGKITYIYIPTTNFAGTDEVEIRSARGSDGASPCDKIINTTIRFTISN